MNNKPMLNAYPDSIGGYLSDIIECLNTPLLSSAFSSFYILPSLYNTDLDRGFSVINYDLNDSLVKEKDLKDLSDMGIDLKLDFILNHASVLSPQFQDLVKNGENSKYRDFFVDWNRFWDGCGKMGQEGYIIPDEKYIKDMFFRKVGFPILMVRFPDGKEVPYWNTFYQEIKYKTLDPQDVMEIVPVQYYVAEKIASLVNSSIEVGKNPSDADFSDFSEYKDDVLDYVQSKRRYLGQMDLNINSPMVWEFYEDTLKRLSEYGADIVRLDAFAYAPKAPGRKNFLNEPETWEVLKRIRTIADKYGLTLLPEIHASYGEGQYEKISKQGYMTYDFFLPGLLIDAIETGDPTSLVGWGKEIIDKNIKTVNMLGCHDGIPLLDLKGLIPEERIQYLIDTIVSRGGYVKDLHGAKNMYYQVNATYYSALGADDKKMLLARAIQLFMPGKPQIWYLDIFAGENDIDALKRNKSLGHKEINRTNYTKDMVLDAIKKDVVIKQCEMIKWRNHCLAFNFDSEIKINSDGENLSIIWNYGGDIAELSCSMKDYSFKIKHNEKYVF